MVSALRTYRKNAGFTLLELSIVLLVIGLVVGGVIAGQDLIRASEERKIVATVEKLRTAMNTFRSKYNCIAGDCAQISAYFPIADAGNGLDLACWNALIDNQGTTGTCVGNGDGYIGSNNFMVEAALLFSHLGYAQLMPSPVLGQGLIAQEFGLFVIPANSRVEISYMLDDNTVSLDPGRSLLAMTKLSSEQFNNVFTGREAQRIDEKMDDGLPRTGRVISGGAVDDIVWTEASVLAGPTGDDVSCITNDTTPVQYNNLGGSTLACSLLIALNK